jgi:hypothetical protein
LAPGGTTEQLAKKFSQAKKGSPQALKRGTFPAGYGTTEVVPFPKTCMKQSFSKPVKPCPSQNPVSAYGNNETALALRRG